MHNSSQNANTNSPKYVFVPELLFTFFGKKLGEELKSFWPKTFTKKVIGVGGSVHLLSAKNKCIFLLKNK